MRRLLRRVPRVVALVIAIAVALGVLTLVILTALGVFAGTGGGPAKTSLPLTAATTRPGSTSG